MSEEIKEILWDCEKQLNEASGYNNTTNKILDYIERLESQLQQKENIIKEVREYAKNDDNFFIIDAYSQPIVDRIQEDILGILDKENKQ